MVCGDQPIRGKHKLKELLLWYAIYCQWSKATGKTPIYDLSMDAEESALDECPGKAADWTRLQAGAVKFWKVSLSLRSVHDPEPSWKRVLNRLSSASDGQSLSDASLMDSIVDDVQYYPTWVVSDAAAALKELMLTARVECKIVRGLDHLKQPQQLQAGLRLLLSRLSVAQKKQISPQLVEWNTACTQLVPTEVQPSDRTSFLKSADGILSKVADTTNWFDVGAHMLLAGMDLPEKCEGFQEVRDAKSMRRAVAQIAQHAQSKALFRVVLQELAEAIPQGAVAEAAGATDELDRLGQSAKKCTASVLGTPAGTSLLPHPEKSEGQETGSEMYTAVPRSQVKDGVVVRLFSLSKDNTSRRYRQAVHDVFGVSCNLDDYQVHRGWYHTQVPKVTVQRVFGAETVMSFKSPSRCIVHARTHDQQGEPYRPYKRPRASQDRADQYDRPAEAGYRQAYPVSASHRSAPENSSTQASWGGTYGQSWY